MDVTLICHQIREARWDIVLKYWIMLAIEWLRALTAPQSPVLKPELKHLNTGKTMCIQNETSEELSMKAAQSCQKVTFLLHKQQKMHYLIKFSN